jgi:LPS-assembly lipoprotein
MWSSSRRALLLLPLLLAGACGFTPLYSRDEGVGGARAELAGVQVRAETDRVHHMVRNELIERLNPRNESAARSYELLFTVREARAGVLVTRQETVSRFNLSLSGAWTLYDKQDGQELARGNVNSTASYNVLRSEFGNVASENDARLRAARDLADTIRLRLAAYFGRQAR